MMSTRNNQLDFAPYGQPLPDAYAGPARSSGQGDLRRTGSDEYYTPTSITYISNSVSSAYTSPISLPNRTAGPSTYPTYNSEPVSISYGNSSLGYGSYGRQSPAPSGRTRKRSPDSFNGLDYGSPDMMALDGPPRKMGSERNQPLRRPSNRDEFDGPTQLLPRPPPEYIAEQERDLPHLPTNLIVQEQDIVLSRVNARLSRCAFDFVAKYEFPIPVDPTKMRPVERPEDREWTEWVYLLKRLATKRRIPARVLYNGQIKQLVTVLENSLEMRHAARNQSRPLKDDRNILQLISAGIQVAKILRDASAMQYLDRLYVSTEQQIQERSASRYLP